MEICCMSQGTQTGALYQPRKVRWEGRWEGGGIYIPMADSCWGLTAGGLVAKSWLFVTFWTLAHLAPLLMGYSKQDYWSGLPFPSPGELPDPGIEPRSPVL